MIKMIETDILVIGAGPAGSTAAKHAAMAGSSVILMDKKSEIDPKRCAEGVSKEGLKKLEIEPSERWVTKELSGVRMVSPNGTAVNLTEDKVKPLKQAISSNVKSLTNTWPWMPAVLEPKS